MKIYNMPRQSGKTILMIKMSNELQIPILTFSATTKRYIKEKAEILGIIIPEPYTLDELKCDRYIKPKEVLIDEVKHVLEKILDTKVIAATMTGDVESKIEEL